MDSAYATLILITINFIVSYQGFTKPGFLDKYKFEVDGILIRKEYYRLVTAAFLHVSWTHLIVNMIVLYSFGQALEIGSVTMVGDHPEFYRLGTGLFVLVYFVSLLGSKALALYIHRQHGDYSAVGASGAVSGILFASVYFSPNGTLLLFFIIPMWAWLAAILYVVYSLYGIRTQMGNVGHEAHLGGAITGLWLTVALYPHILPYRVWLVLVLTVPVVLFLIAYIRNPSILLLPFGKTRNFKFNQPRRGPRPTGSDYRRDNPQQTLQQQLDTLLDKVSNKGYNNLTAKEKDRLNELSRHLSNKRNYTQGGRSSDRGGPSGEA